ncbi:MAG: hypothetical protein CML60_08645 [Rhodobacteraceae bacterium]|nr:hypothetical protein [Paracoccaceae bacterium]MBT26449.1 hypothetical protein [Paracoccaceae bacterium]
MGGALASPVVASDARLSLTLAGAAPAEGACRLSFLAENQIGTDLDAMVLEAVIFTASGTVDRLLLLDFRTLPQGKPRVRQFDLPGTDCASVGQILINGAHACQGAELAENACMGALVPASRVDGIEVTG